MRLRVPFFVVIGVVGGKIFHPIFIGQLKQHLVDFILFGDPMPVELHVKIFPKLLFPPDKGFLCLRFSHIENEVGDLAPNASCAGNQVSLVLYK